MYHICTLLVNILIFIYDVTLNSVILHELHHLQADLTHFYMPIYKSNFFQAQICTNDYFAPNKCYVRGDNFVVSCYL